MEREQAFLETILQAIVEFPRDVRVDRRVDEMGVLLTVSVNKQDMGRVIGRQGATSDALRLLLRIVGMREQKRVNVKILEPEGSDREERPTMGQETMRDAMDHIKE